MIWPFLLFWKGDRKTITVKQASLIQTIQVCRTQKIIVNSKCHATCIYDCTVRYNVRCWNQCIRFVFIRNLLINLLKNVEYCWQYLLLNFLTYLPDNTELPLAAGKRTPCSYLKFITWSTSTTHSSRCSTRSPLTFDNLRLLSHVSM